MTHLFISVQLLVNDGSANFEARRVFEDPYATSYYETALNDVVSLDVDSDGDQVRPVLTEGKETQTRGVPFSSFVTRFNIDSSSNMRTRLTDLLTPCHGLVLNTPT